MKVSRIAANEPVVRSTLSLAKSVSDDISAYRDCYRETYGNEISANKLIEEVMRDLMSKDKEFQKWKEAKKVTLQNTSAS